MIIRKFISFFSMQNLLILGSLFVLVSSVWAIRNIVVLHRGFITSGIVTAVRPTSSDEQPFYETTFSFNAKDKKSYTVTPNFEERPAPYKIGDNVTVVYNATNPYDATLSSYKDMWHDPVYFGSLGAAMLLVGLMLLRRKRLRQASHFGASSHATQQT